MKEAMSPGLGCTHIIEMLAQMASGAKQAMWSRKPGQKIDMLPPEQREIMPGMLNTCYAYRQDSELVQQYFPRSYIASDKG